MFNWSYGVDEAKRRKVDEISDLDPSYNHILTYKTIKKYLQGKDVLDIGCWTGQYEKLAIHTVKKMIGLDPGKDAIKIASSLFRNDKKISFQTGYAENLRFPNNSFDVVLFSEVLEHLPKSSEVKAIREIKRVLKPNGILALTTPHKDVVSVMFDPAFFLLGHRHYSCEDLTRLLTGEGFFITKMSRLGGIMSLIAGNTELIYKHLLRIRFKPPVWMSKMIEDEWSGGFVRLLVIAQKKTK